jgi:glutathione synthase/RimK-type ligase-like ATP-grasp enzyme
MFQSKEKDNMQRQFLEGYGLKLVPDWNVHRFYDNKVLQTYTYQSENIPHPETHIFYSQLEAGDYLQKLKTYPIVIKANAGAGSKSTRFCNNFIEAITQLRECFDIGLEYQIGKREKGFFYCQEYIKAPGIFRIVMIGDDIAYSFYQSNKPGTLIASSQGYDSYPDTPPELLALCRHINYKMNWQYMMYDLIWSEEKNQWFILEVTDTCGQGHSAKRKYTHYFENGKWIDREENTSPQELIFNSIIKKYEYKKI